jgi:hypothetical protein
MLSADISHSGKAIVSLPPGTYTAHIETDGKEVAQQVIDVKGKKTVSIVTQHTSLIYTLVIVLGMIGIGIAAVLFLLKKKHLMAAIKLAVIGLIMIALVSSWWTLEGEQSHWTTTTNTRLIPAKIVTITTDDEVAGGNISSVPPEFSLVLMLIALLLMLVALLVFTQVWLEEKHARLGIVLGLLSIILVCLSLVLFQYAMSQVTQVGVGGFSGSGTLEVSIPGDLAGSKTFSCSWGPGTGFYLGILVAVLLVLCFVYKYKKHLYLLGKKVRNIRSKRGQTT